MRMDPGIILSGRPVNALAALDAGTQAGARAGEARQRGGVLSLYRDQGPAILAGDQNALSALAQFSPQEALGIQQTQQGMRINEERLNLARAEGARAAEAHAAQLSAMELERERQQIAQGLATAVPALRNGDLDTVNQILRTAGLEPARSLEEAAYIISGYEGALERYDAMQGVMGQGAAPQMEGAALTRHQQALAGGLQPETPEYQHFMLTGQPMPAPGQAADTGAEDALRGEFTGDRVVREFQQQAPAFRRILAAGEDPSAAGDMALIFNFMKLLDPGSTVREGEFATAQNAGGVDSRIRSLYNSVIDGTRLDERQRSDFLDRAQRLYLSAEEGYNQVRDFYADTAGNRGMNADRVLPDYRVADRLMTQDPGGSVTFAPPPGIAPQPNPQPAPAPAPAPQGGRPVRPGDAMAGQDVPPPPDGFPADIWRFLASDDARARAARLWADMTPEERQEYLRRARGEQ